MSPGGNSGRSSIHLTIGGSNNDNCTVHVGGTSDHVLNVIGVTGAVNVGVVTVVGRELNVSSRDGDTTLTLLGGLVNGAIFEEAGKTLGGLVLGDSGSQSSLVVCSVSWEVRQTRRDEQECSYLTFPWSTWPMVPKIARLAVVRYYERPKVNPYRC